MDKREARAILAARLEKLKQLTYDELAEAFLNDPPMSREPTWENVVSDSGARYYLKI